MKTTLPKRSLVIKDRLDDIVRVILDVAKPKLAMIILFGSYARGDWVEDDYVENHINYVYQSDLDLMLVMKKSKYDIGYEGIRIEEKIEKILEFLRLDGPIDSNYKGKPPVTLIFESIESVTIGCELGYYFYSDIKKEGIILYDIGEFILPEPRNLTFEEWKKKAQEDYDEWFYLGYDFLITCKDDIKKDNYNYRIIVFLLHHAAECIYSAILLVFSGYKPKTHDLKKLKNRTKRYAPELKKVFPHFTVEQRECFKLLREAYIRARYDKTYKITEEQLLYLIERVELLKNITEEICNRHLKTRH